jgi:hypothetical protein
VGRQLKEATITTRNARLGLRTGLYWRAIDRDVHLGYRKGRRSGSWMVRWRNGPGYKQAPLATADDALTADGTKVLSFDQATAACRAHVEAARARERLEAAGPTPTVRVACEVYYTTIETNRTNLGGKPSKASRSRLQTHVLTDPMIAEIALHELLAVDIQEWKARLRGKDIAESTVRRISNDFRAALNAAAVRHRAVLPAQFAIEIGAGFKITNDDPAAKIRPPEHHSLGR